MLDSVARVEEYANVDAACFGVIRRGNRPAVLRGLVDSWPLVVHGRRSPQAIVDYLTGFYNGSLVSTVTARPEVRGRLFYEDDARALNFAVSVEKMSSVLKGLLRQIDAPDPIGIAMQGVSAAEHLPGLEADHPMPLVPPGTGARLWIGNRVTVAPHFDVADNIACVVAGRRRFVLFPPEQLPNLYVGPFDLTPAGVPVSMVRFDDPDFDTHPRFRDALAAAQVAELGPGDALYIPYMWWHGVQSLDPLSILVNYWWNADAVSAQHPYGALLHAATLLYRDMPAEQRAIWRTMHDHYVFGVNGDPAAHLRPEHRDRHRPIAPAAVAGLKSALADLIDGAPEQQG
ncbi:cupin-like domain-containing protein [Sphingosinicella sp. BN140058]|uniref:cupin-like domain-containing protein n=1 Tax=Sphingosinicella sp. BN140058 TaxID=1892855 RepID=UPI001013B745|nr:cupin-like domain-containing protein [Sphingosinicella sp. BN140058]QAY76409.1 cupin-like domain-containing protein [Sphingosinicella sp. BN140058]